jgi:hypothetical protein
VGVSSTLGHIQQTCPGEEQIVIDHKRPMVAR